MGVVIYRRSGDETVDEVGPLGAELRRRFLRNPEARAIVVGDGPPAQEGYQIVNPPALCDVHYFRRAGEGRPRWAGAVSLATAECSSLREAMGIVISRIVPTGHGHIVHTGRGLQVVDRARILGGIDVRPMAHMPFDGGADEFEAILRLLECAWGDELMEYDLGGIPCFGLPLEGNARSMERILHGLVAAIEPPWLPPPARIPATIYDEAPPGAGLTPLVGYTGGPSVCHGGFPLRGLTDRYRH